MFWLLTNAQSRDHYHSLYSEPLHPHRWPQCPLAAPTPALHPPVCFLSLWFSIFQNVTLCEALELWLLSLSNSSRLSCASVIGSWRWLRRFPCVDRPQRSPKGTRAVPVLDDCEERHNSQAGQVCCELGVDRLSVTSLGEGGWAGPKQLYKKRLLFFLPSFSTSTEQPGPGSPLIASAPHPPPRPMPSIQCVHRFTGTCNKSNPS